MLDSEAGHTVTFKNFHVAKHRPRSGKLKWCAHRAQGETTTASTPQALSAISRQCTYGKLWKMYWKNTSVCLYGIYLHLDLSYHCLPLCLITFQSPTTWLSCERCMSESAHGLCDQVCKQNMSGYLFQPEKGVTKASISFKFTRSVKHIWEQPGLRFPGISPYTSDSHNRLSSASPLGLISYKPCLDSKSQTPISIFVCF